MDYEGKMEGGMSSEKGYLGSHLGHIWEETWIWEGVSSMKNSGKNFPREREDGENPALLKEWRKVTGVMEQISEEQGLRGRKEDNHVGVIM